MGRLLDRIAFGLADVAVTVLQIRITLGRMKRAVVEEIERVMAEEEEEEQARRERDR